MVNGMRPSRILRARSKTPRGPLDVPWHTFVFSEEDSELNVDVIAVIVLSFVIHFVVDWFLPLRFVIRVSQKKLGIDEETCSIV